jgi:hypothetical protein
MTRFLFAVVDAFDVLCSGLTIWVCADFELHVIAFPHSGWRDHVVGMDVNSVIRVLI